MITRSAHSVSQSPHAPPYMDAWPMPRFPASVHALELEVHVENGALSE